MRTGAAGLREPVLFDKTKYCNAVWDRLFGSVRIGLSGAKFHWAGDSGLFGSGAEKKRKKKERKKDR